MSATQHEVLVQPRRLAKSSQGVEDGVGTVLESDLSLSGSFSQDPWACLQLRGMESQWGVATGTVRSLGP